MKISFLGAARIVTGSCYLIETKSSKILVDCGLFQGEEDTVSLNYEKFHFNPSEIDYVILTHAHEDHSGRLPKLVKEGFKGKIISTTATRDLCTVMLEDSAHVQEVESKRKEIREHAETISEPLYDELDVKRTMTRFKPVEYNNPFKLNETMKMCFREAGHILGAAIVELSVNEDGKSTKLVFSGDIGQKGTLIVRPTSKIDDADYLFLESTYGNRLHPKVDDKNQLLLKYVNDALKKGGKLIIPSFAVQRSQEMIYRFKRLSEAGLLKNETVYLDSPLAIKVTSIFEKHKENYNDELKRTSKPFYFPGLVFSKTREESIKLNAEKGPLIVMAGSGMCSGGRILHHLRHGLSDEKNTVLFIGYQAAGTLGRRLVEGAEFIHAFGEKIPVKADIQTIWAFSGHADYEQLIEWLSYFKKNPKKIFVVHGEEESALAFSNRLSSLGYKTYVPKMYESIEI